MESILNSIKKLLGISENDTAFDVDLIIHINSVFSILAQLGATSKENYKISSSSDTWSDYIGDFEDLELLKSYMYLRVKIIFDPPQSSFVMESYKKIIDELEWRITTIADKN
jgi:hypothetical protein